ncbi:hypothetical protein MCUN1_002089 [Malassezia cuniculi]|uniref:Indoleamine 2,3-dioxygenase n=1 Tax=Malassezia cuniculi TaxID=948313 RepID=A0AAF0ER40_9BASI|nr:hypothetical protein MCUN1_002089 [Malassezia cuniculi]
MSKSDHTAGALVNQADTFKVAVDNSTLAAADFDVDVRSGFLPPEPPVARLPDGMGPWEDLFDWAKRIPLQLAGQIGQSTEKEARAWRAAVRNAPVVHIDVFGGDVRLLRRANLVLSFLAHMYIHSQPDVGQFEKDDSKITASPAKWSLWRDTIDGQRRADEMAGRYASTLPASIAVPLAESSRALGLPPVLTYATTVLWNWGLIDPAKGMVPENMKILETFTQTASERHFFLTSLLIELHGVKALSLMRDALNEAFAADELAMTRIAQYLDELADVIDKLCKVLADVRTDCDPAAFYWDIRPWFRAGDSTFAGSGAERRNGWRFEGVEEPEYQQALWTGPSAGQSTLIHAIDVFLDVDHSHTKLRHAKPGFQSAERNGDGTFMQRMQRYMPRLHREFLEHLCTDTAAEVVTAPARPGAEPESTDHPVRALVMQCLWAGDDHPLVCAYDKALSSLRRLRDEHMRVAVHYIVKQAKRPRVATSSAPGEQDEDKVKGTGGTDLVSFLSDCRKNTQNALLSGK